MRTDTLLRTRRATRGHFAPLILLAALLPACDSPAAPGSVDGAMDAAVMVSASVIGTPIDVIVIEITGPGISTPLVYNLDVVSGVASGTLRMPAGPDRLFDVKAYDDINEITHEGSVIRDVKRGSNPPIELPLVPRSGHVPITITMGDYLVGVDPPTHDMVAGQVFQLTATVTYPDGSSAPGPVSWATLNPSLATVDADGNVTAISEGTVTIVATYDGIGGSSEISIMEVLGPVFPPPGGVTLAESGDGMGRATGLTWSFSDFDLTQTAALAWGQSTDFPVLVALDGAADAPEETLTIDADQSDLDLGVLVWTGQTTIHVWDGTAFVPTETPTRVTVTVTEGGAAKTLEDADAIGRSEIGGVALVAGPFEAHVLVEAQYAGTWQPALDLYDSLDTNDSGTITSFGGGFYYIPPPSP